MHFSVIDFLFLCPCIKYKGGEAVSMIKKSIDIGYRHFDTAFLYNNESEVGEGIREKISEGIVTRDDVFVSAKVFILLLKHNLIKN